jgi:hypothetical protein
VVKPIFETVLMALFIGIAVVINLNLLIDTSQAVRYERTSYMCVRSLSPSLVQLDPDASSQLWGGGACLSACVSGGRELFPQVLA